MLKIRTNIGPCHVGLELSWGETKGAMLEVYKVQKVFHWMNKHLLSREKKSTNTEGQHSWPGTAKKIILLLSKLTSWQSLNYGVSRKYWYIRILIFKKYVRIVWNLGDQGTTVISSISFTIVAYFKNNAISKLSTMKLPVSCLAAECLSQPYRSVRTRLAYK